MNYGTCTMSINEVTDDYEIYLAKNKNSPVRKKNILLMRSKGDSRLINFKRFKMMGSESIKNSQWEKSFFAHLAFPKRVKLL